MLDLARFDLALMEESAGRAAALLRLLANETRLMVLCQLADGELSVGAIQARINLSQSALSQHLARLRRDHLVVTRRAAQTIYYSLTGREVSAIMETLYIIYCEPVKAP